MITDPFHPLLMTMNFCGWIGTMEYLQVLWLVSRICKQVHCSTSFAPNFIIGSIWEPGNWFDSIFPCHFTKQYFFDMTTNYLVKGVEVKPLKMFKKEKVKRFVYERILTCFEITLKMVWNNGPQFANDVILKFMKKLAIKHHMTNTYKPNINIF